MEGDFAYIVDLLDEVLEQPGAREHEFPWLRDEQGAPVVVAAYYEQRDLGVMLLRESEDMDELDPELRKQMATMLARGVEPLLLVTGMFAHDESGRLRRSAEDRKRIESVMESVDDDLCRIDYHEKLGLVPRSAEQTAFYTSGWDDEDEEWDDEDVPSEEPEEEAAEFEWPEGSRSVAPQGPFSERARPLALAALGAAALGRRAFSAQTTSAESLDIQVLVAIALSGTDEEHGESAASLATTLAVAEYDLERVLKRLRGSRQVTDVAYEDDAESYVLTAKGETMVEAWLERIGVLFPGWPPDDPGLDDAAGVAS